MKRTKIKELLNCKEEQESVLVKGWVRTRRDSKGGFSFLEINDGSCLGNIQAIVDHSLNEFQELDKQITTGSCSLECIFSHFGRKNICLKEALL